MGKQKNFRFLCGSGRLTEKLSKKKVVATDPYYETKQYRTLPLLGELLIF